MGRIFGRPTLDYDGAMRLALPRPSSAVLLLAQLGVAAACTPTPRTASTTSASGPSAASRSATPAPPRVLSRRAPGSVAAPRFLVILLHGWGSSADDLAPVAERFASSLPEAEVLVPDGLEAFDHAAQAGPGARQWYSLLGDHEARREERLRPAARALAAWVDAELDRRGLPRERVFFSGFSQGAIISEWLAVFRAPPPLGVVAYAGLLAVDEPVEASRTRTPVLLVHGDADARIPPARAEEARAGLTARGAPVELLLEPGLGHSLGRAGIERGIAFVAAHAPR